jgi:hypothetical protein
VNRRHDYRVSVSANGHRLSQRFDFAKVLDRYEGRVEIVLTSWGSLSWKIIRKFVSTLFWKMKVNLFWKIIRKFVMKNESKFILKSHPKVWFNFVLKIWEKFVMKNESKFILKNHPKVCFNFVLKNESNLSWDFRSVHVMGSHLVSHESWSLRSGYGRDPYTRYALTYMIYPVWYLSSFTKYCNTSKSKQHVQGRQLVINLNNVELCIRCEP